MSVPPVYVLFPYKLSVPPVSVRLPGPETLPESMAEPVVLKLVFWLSMVERFDAKPLARGTVPSRVSDGANCSN